MPLVAVGSHVLLMAANNAEMTVLALLTTDWGVVRPVLTGIEKLKGTITHLSLGYAKWFG